MCKRVIEEAVLGERQRGEGQDEEDRGVTPLQDRVCSQFDSTWEAENELCLGVSPHRRRERTWFFHSPLLLSISRQLLWRLQR